MNANVGLVNTTEEAFPFNTLDWDDKYWNGYSWLYDYYEFTYDGITFNNTMDFFCYGYGLETCPTYTYRPICDGRMFPADPDYP